MIAGLGNIYVDEALWEAHLHPQKIANTMTEQESFSLLHAIQKVLKQGLRTQGTTLGSGKTNYYRPNGTRGSHQDKLNVFRRTDQPCPRCSSRIIKLKIAQRSTHICPNCQILK